MWKFVCALTMAGFLAGSAWAADEAKPAEAGNPGRPGGGQRFGGMANAPLSPFLKFLNLTKEQTDKVDALAKEKSAAQQALYKDRPKGTDREEAQKFFTAVQEKVKTLNADYRTKLLEILTEEQKTKFLATEKANEDYQKTLHEFQIKAVAEREDAILKALGDSYKEQAEKNKEAAKAERAYPRGPVGGQ